MWWWYTECETVTWHSHSQLEQIWYLMWGKIWNQCHFTVINSSDCSRWTLNSFYRPIQLVLQISIANTKCLFSVSGCAMWSSSCCWSLLSTSQSRGKAGLFPFDLQLHHSQYTDQRGAKQLCPSLVLHYSYPFLLTRHCCKKRLAGFHY